MHSKANNGVNNAGRVFSSAHVRIGVHAASILQGYWVLQHLVITGHRQISKLPKSMLIINVSNLHDDPRPRHTDNSFQQLVGSMEQTSHSPANSQTVQVRRFLP